MFDPERLLGQMLGGSLGDAFGGKRGRRKRSAFSTGNLAGKATLGVGLLGIAMAAWEHYGQQKNAAPSPVGPAPAAGPSSPPPPPPSTAAIPPPAPSGVATRGMPVLDDRQQAVVLLIRAMIAAANADGHIDARERAAIIERARDSGVNDETLAFLEAEIARPQTLQQVIANARPGLASETYAAAALAITVDTDEERVWLDMLAHGLKLDATTRADIDARLAAVA
jgi:uncharacterized membrane protein YebE (DUF533 family)